MKEFSLVDALVVAKRLSKLREYVGFLKEIRLKSREEFTTNPFVYGNAERYLQLAIQTMLDIGNHILADRKLKEPEEYRDVMKILGEQKLLPQSLVQRLLPLVGLRNILVHDYLDIDRAKLYDALQQELSDFEEFGLHISKLL